VLSFEVKTARVIIKSLDHVIKSLVHKTARVMTRPQSRPLAQCCRVVLHVPAVWCSMHHARDGMRVCLV
jgi:hypothetical protein